MKSKFSKKSVSTAVEVLSDVFEKLLDDTRCWNEGWNEAIDLAMKQSKKSDEGEMYMEALEEFETLVVREFIKKLILEKL